MNLIKRLASQTAVYGLSSIVGRFLNYLLVPIHVRLFTTAEYGAVTYFYSFVSFIAIVLTYGMETAFFKFYSSEEEKNKERIYSTAFISLLITSSVFFVLVWHYSSTIAIWLKYPKYPQYVTWFAGIMALDALSALPFAKLRMHNKAWHFALIKLMNIIINIAFNVLFLILFPKYGWYNKPLTIGTIFMANLIASACTLLLLIPVMLNTTFVFDLLKWKQLIKYGVPLMLAGLAGMINETFDRIALRYLLPPGPQSEHYMGVYGGCYKLAMLMTIFIQAYRFAAEPFFFGRQKEKNNRTLYAQSLNYFIIVCCLIFIGITLFIDWIKWFLSPAYYEGLSIIPVLLLANLFLGMYINFSMWFKLNGQTHYGLLFSVFGALITIIGLYTLVPIIGYQGAAYTTLICYFLMATSCFIVGQLKYPIPYNVKKISLYLLFSLLIYYVNTKYFSHINSINLLLKGIAILTFIVLIYILEKSKKVVA